MKITEHFETYKETAEWFDTHDMVDYEDQLKPVDFDCDLRKNRNWVELDRKIAKYLRKFAREQHVSTQRLVNELLKEKIENL